MLMAAGWALGAFVFRPQSSSASTHELSPALRELWTLWWTGQDREPIICFSNPLTAVIKHFPQAVPADAVPSRMKVGGEEEKIFRQKFALPSGGHIYLTPVINQGKMGEAIAAVDFASFFSGLGLKVKSTQSRFLSWDDIRAQDLILLGHNEANQWIDPLLKDYPYHLRATGGEQQRGIVIPSPVTGEQPSYTISYSGKEDEADEEYALVSMIRGVGNGRELLIVSGLNTQATQFATEYLTSEATAAELLGRLRKGAPNHRGAWHFQAVLKTAVYDKVPTKGALVVVRVLD
jgi:hypothetical protein